MSPSPFDCWGGFPGNQGTTKVHPWVLPYIMTWSHYWFCSWILWVSVKHCHELIWCADYKLSLLVLYVAVGNSYWLAHVGVVVQFVTSCSHSQLQSFTIVCKHWCSSEKRCLQAVLLMDSNMHTELWELSYNSNTCSNFKNIRPLEVISSDPCTPAVCDNSMSF